MDDMWTDKDPLTADRRVPPDKIRTVGLELYNPSFVSVGNMNRSGDSPLIWGVWIGNVMIKFDNLPIIYEQDIPAAVGMKYWDGIVKEVLISHWGEGRELDEYIQAIMTTQVREILLECTGDGVRITLTTMHNRSGIAFIEWNYQSDDGSDIWQTTFKIDE